MKTTSNHAQAAKMMRAELKKAFPAIKFSINSKSYAGGSSINVSWDLGPTTAMVATITSKYKYGHFDGMTDMYEYSNTIKDLPQVQYVFANRNYTDEVKEQAAKTLTLRAEDCIGYWSTGEQVYRILREMDLTNGFQG